MTSLQAEEEQKSNPQTPLRQPTSLRKKSPLMNRKKEMYVNLTPPKNEYFPISIRSPSESSPFSVRSSGLTETNEEEDLRKSDINPRTSNQVFIVNRKNNSDDISFSENADVVWSDTKPIPEASRRDEKSFTFKQEKESEKGAIELLEEENSMDLGEGISALRRLKEDRENMKAAMKVQEKEEDPEGEKKKTIVKKKKKNIEGAEAPVGEDGKVKKKKKKVKKEEVPNGIAEVDEERETTGNFPDLNISQKHRVHKKVKEEPFRKSSREELHDLESLVQEEMRINRAKRLLMAKLRHEMDKDGGLNFTDLDYSPRGGYDPSLRLSGGHDSEKGLISPNASFPTLPKHLSDSHATNDYFMKETTQDTARSKKKSKKKHSENEEEMKGEKKEKKSKKDKEKKKKKHKKHHKEEEKQRLNDGNAEENNEEENEQNEAQPRLKKALLTDGLDLLKMMLDRRNRKKSKAIILVFTLAVILSLVLSGLEVAEFNSANCRVDMYEGLIYICFAAMVLLKLFCISLFNLELVYKQPYNPLARMLFPFLICLMSPLLQFPQNTYRWKSCEEGNRIVDANQSWKFLIAFICNAVFAIGYFLFKKKAKTAAASISLVSRMFGCLSKLIKVIVVLSVVAWNVILFVIFVTQVGFNFNFLVDFILYVFCGLCLASLLVLKKKVDEVKLAEFFVKVEEDPSGADNKENKPVEVVVEGDKAPVESGLNVERRIEEIQIEVK